MPDAVVAGASDVAAGTMTTGGLERVKRRLQMGSDEEHAFACTRPCLTGSGTAASVSDLASRLRMRSGRTKTNTFVFLGHALRATGQRSLKKAAFSASSKRISRASWQGGRGCLWPR